MVNHLGGRCVVLVLRANLPILKKEVHFIWELEFPFLWLLGINEKKSVPNPKSLRSQGAEIMDYKCLFFCEQQTLDQ